MVRLAPAGAEPIDKAEIIEDAGAWVAWKTYDPEKGVDFDRVIHVEDPNGGYFVSDFLTGTLAGRARAFYLFSADLGFDFSSPN